jgi:hypothetical protein
MVRTYWLVPVFNEASGNLDLQLSARRPNRCLSAPCYVQAILALLSGLPWGAGRVGRGHVLVAVLAPGCA